MIEKTENAHTLPACRPLWKTQLWRIVCTMGMAMHNTKTKPNPKSAHNEPRDPSFQLVKITKHATRQTSNVGSCINNIERNILSWSGVFINLDGDLVA